MHCRQEHEEGEASAVSNLYRGRSLVFRDHGEQESIVFEPVRQDSLSRHAL